MASYLTFKGKSGNQIKMMMLPDGQVYFLKKVGSKQTVRKPSTIDVWNKAQEYVQTNIAKPCPAN